MKKNLITSADQLQTKFEKAETDLLRAALKRTFTERFLVMTSLMKRSIMLKNAKVAHVTSNQS